MSKSKMITVKMTISRGGAVPATRGDEIEVSRLDAARMLRAGQIAPLAPDLAKALMAELSEAEGPTADEKAAAEKAAAEKAAAEKAAAEKAAAEKAAQ